MKKEQGRPAVRIAGREYRSLLEKIGGMIAEARRRVVREIDRTQVVLYWQIGRTIVEHEQKGKHRAEYGDELIERLAGDMTQQFGRGFSQTNLKMMRLFYLSFPIRQTVSDEFTGSRGTARLNSETVSRNSVRMTGSRKYEMPSRILSWSHYCELLKEENGLARSFYEKESAENNWSVRELKRQINALLFERLAMSRNKGKILELAKRGQVIERPEDAIKEPYVLEFLNLREDPSYSEERMEQALIDKLQYFLLEMGKGFSFVARQKRITVANRHYHIDLVLYNRFLKCFVLVDLKSGELDHADVGQMNFYLNYFRENEKSPEENDPIGLVLCAKKDEVFAKYVLGGMRNRIFASKYKLALPSEKALRRELLEDRKNNW
jgi:predicted nuclease of restriction endonuclease-like (RecB) superfamily